MQLPRRLAAKQEEVELLVARRLGLLAATLAQPAVARRIVHGAEHGGGTERGREPLASGGEVVILEFVEGFSTTATIKRISTHS